MADLPTVVRGMLFLASDEFLGLVEDESRGLERGVAVVRECLHQQQQWQVRSRIHERLRDAHDFAVGDDGRRERARVAELVGRDVSTLREDDVANRQRARILENLCRAELASARLGPSERGPLRSPAAVARWEGDREAHSSDLPDVDAVVMRVGAACGALGSCKGSDTRQPARLSREALHWNVRDMREQFSCGAAADPAP